jgi:hypothetical protein
MARVRLASIGLALAAAGTAARADAPTGVVRSVGDSFHAYNVEVGLGSSAPVMFKDTPDMTLSATTVFLYGGHLGLSFGDELVDAHRFGVQVAYDTVARSADRSLKTITPMLTYQTGHPFQLQVGLGWAIATGTKGFADNYGGFASEATLRWSFQHAAHPSKVSVALGLTGRLIAASSNFDYTSGFIGVHLDLGLHLGTQGGHQ